MHSSTRRQKSAVNVFFKLELGHFGQLPTVAVGVLDELLSKFVCIDGLCPCLVECGVTVLDAETVLDD